MGGYFLCACVEGRRDGVQPQVHILECTHEALLYSIGSGGGNSITVIGVLRLECREETSIVYGYLKWIQNTYVAFCSPSIFCFLPDHPLVWTTTSFLTQCVLPGT